MGGFVAFAKLSVVCSTCGVLVEDALMDEALLPFFFFEDEGEDKGVCTKCKQRTAEITVKRASDIFKNKPAEQS